MGIPRGNNRANYKGTRTRFPSSYLSTYLSTPGDLSSSDVWIGRKFAAKTRGNIRPRMRYASTCANDHKKYPDDRRPVEAATARETLRNSHRACTAEEEEEREEYSCLFRSPGASSLADSPRRSRRIDARTISTSRPRDPCFLSLSLFLASRIRPRGSHRRSSRRPRENFRESSPLGEPRALSRTRAERTGVDTSFVRASPDDNLLSRT